MTNWFAVRKKLGSAFVIALILGIAPAARADLLNGGFETGDFTSWSTSGVTSVVTASIGIAPTEGIFQAFIQNADDGSDSTTDALEDFLGLASGTLSSLGFGAVISGSAIKQTVTTGFLDNQLAFDMNFLTNDPGEAFFRDFSFATINGIVVPLLDTLTPSVGPGAGFVSQSGWYGVGITGGFGPGTYTIGFGVVNVEDPGIASAILVDNTRFVPEPSSLVLLGLGGAGLIGTLKRRRRQGKSPV